MERAGDEVAPLPHSGAGQQQQVRGRGTRPSCWRGQRRRHRPSCLSLAGRRQPGGRVGAGRWAGGQSGGAGAAAPGARPAGCAEGDGRREPWDLRPDWPAWPRPPRRWRSRSWLVAHAGTAAPGSPWALLRRESGRERPRQFVDAAVRGPPLPCAPPRAAA